MDLVLQFEVHILNISAKYSKFWFFSTQPIFPLFFLFPCSSMSFFTVTLPLQLTYIGHCFTACRENSLSYWIIFEALMLFVLLLENSIDWPSALLMIPGLPWLYFMFLLDPIFFQSHDRIVNILTRNFVSSLHL